MSAIFFYVGNTASLDADEDQPYIDHLEDVLLHTVTVKDDGDSDWTGADALIFSESITTTDIAWAQDDAIGMMVSDGTAWDELDMGTGGVNQEPTDDTANILDNTHFITSEESTGNLVIRTTTASSGNVEMAGAATGKNIADWTVGGDSVIIAYETGDTLVSGSPSTTAPDRRVFFGIKHFATCNAAGKGLYDRCVKWILHEESDLEQEGFRWYNDGTESASTVRQNQDVVDTVAKELTVQLRVLINATDDPNTAQFELQYKETADGVAEWRKLPLT